MNSAENLCRKIIEEAEAAVAKKETEVQSEVSAILEAANGKARAIEKETSIEMKRRCDAYDERVNAVCQKAVRSAVLLEKARILDSVVADAEKALCALDGAPYVTFVASLFASCGELKNPVVYLQENRVSQKAALQTRLGTDRLEFVPYVDGGVLIREDDIDYDCRVSTVLNRFRNEHEPELQDILFGDNR